MRVVVDTNVVVSAILRDRVPEKVLLFIIARPDFQWVASPEILTEYREDLRRPKFGLPDSVLSQWDERFDSAIAEWPVEMPVSFPRDVKDARFLACALRPTWIFSSPATGISQRHANSDAQKSCRSASSMSLYAGHWIDADRREACPVLFASIRAIRG